MKVNQSHAYAALALASLVSMAVFVQYIDGETTKNNAMRASYDAWCPGGPRGTPVNPAFSAYLPYLTNQTQVAAWCRRAAPEITACPGSGP